MSLFFKIKILIMYMSQLKNQAAVLPVNSLSKRVAGDHLMHHRNALKNPDEINFLFFF